MMSVGLGRTARMEALIAMLWLAADVTFLGLVLQSCRGLWEDVLELRGERVTGGLLTAAVLGTALWVQRSGDAEGLLRDVIPVGGLVLGGGIPVLLWAMAGKHRETGEEAPYFVGEHGPHEAYLEADGGTRKKSKKIEKNP